MEHTVVLPEAKRVTDKFDACVIGSGASGAFVTEVLVRAGWNVILIEQGKELKPGTNLNHIWKSFEHAYARDRQGRWTLNGYPWTACALGGGTNVYAGVSFRYRSVDFDPRRFTASNAMNVQWPISYDDLRNYYDQVEIRLGISRADGLDPTEPPGAKPVLPPHPFSRRGSLIAQAAEKLHLKPFPTPLAIHSIPYQGFPSCQNLTACIDYTCPIQAKADTVTRILNPLLQMPNYTLCTQTKAVRFHQCSPHQIESLECIDIKNSTRFAVRARLFIMAGNAIQTAALVLRSNNSWWPLGVGNTGLVGKGLCFKVSEYVAGWVDVPSASSWESAREKKLRGLYSTVSLTDYYFDSECPSGLGGLIYEANPFDDGTPVQDRSEVLLRLECILADQPIEDNQVRLSNIKDNLGLPKLMLDYRTHPLDEARLKHIIHRAKQILHEAKAKDIYQEPTYYSFGSAHLHGTCRAGDDPDTSVVNKYGRFHNIENLYVADGSFMPFPGGVNPTMTIQANALRIAHCLTTFERKD